MLAVLARAKLPRTIGPRLSIGTEYRECSLHPAPEGTIPVTRCERKEADAIPPDEILGLVSVSRSIPATTNPDSLHAVALLDLLWADDEGKSLGRSISLLQAAARLSDRPGPVLSDLAAAHLVRAEHSQNPRDLLEAIWAAEQAVKLEPDHAAARFNLALALDRMGLEEEAAMEWERQASLDEESAWMREASGRVQQIRTRPPPPERPSDDAPSAVLAAYAARAPQDARLWGWDDLLADWGAAVLEGNSARAGRRLRSAGLLGRELERRGGDATLADAVRAIRENSGDPVAIRKLAHAHHHYGIGAAAFSRLEQEAADSSFLLVLAARPPSPALVQWATMFHAGARILLAQHEPGIEILRPLAEGVDEERHPALAGRVRGALATAFLRAGKPEHARAAAGEAARLLARAGETEHAGGAQYVAAEAEFNLGATADAYASIHRALGTLRPYRRSVWLSNLLSAAARTADADGLGRVALRFQNERVAVARRTGKRAVLAEAHLGRAQALIADGEHDPARADLRAGADLVEQLRPGRTRRWLTTDLRLARASLALRSDPRGAVAILDSVVSDSAGSRTAVRRLRALVERADARLAGGDIAGAVRDLDAVTSLVAGQSTSLSRGRLRASLAGAAQEVFDRVVLLKLQEGDTAAALRYLEQGRTSFGSGGSLPGGRHWSIPHRQVALDYALIADTLLVWTVDGTSETLTRRTVRHDDLTRRIESARSALELGREADARAELAGLYDVLIRPVREQLGGEGTHLVVVADGQIAGVPFAALYDAERGRYLVQDHPLRMAGSLRDAAGRSGRGGAPPSRALLVADPAFDERVHPGLERLAGARAEVSALAGDYRDAEVLADTAVQRDRFLASLGRAHVVHFAGHALFDDERPERSSLLLATDGVDERSGRLTASEVEELDLRGVRLVVLSACETLRSHTGRSGGFAGLAAALLGAGAGGVVGSLWRVDDELTRPLMIEFHREYRRNGRAPEALRAAQLRMLRSPDPALRSPAAWAGFRYAGY